MPSLFFPSWLRDRPARPSDRVRPTCCLALENLDKRQMLTAYSSYNPFPAVVSPSTSTAYWSMPTTSSYYSVPTTWSMPTGGSYGYSSSGYGTSTVTYPPNPYGSSSYTPSGYSTSDFFTTSTPFFSSTSTYSVPTYSAVGSYSATPSYGTSYSYGGYSTSPYAYNAYSASPYSYNAYSVSPYAYNGYGTGSYLSGSTSSSISQLNQAAYQLQSQRLSAQATLQAKYDELAQLNNEAVRLGGTPVSVPSSLTSALSGYGSSGMYGSGGGNRSGSTPSSSYSGSSSLTPGVYTFNGTAFRWDGSKASPVWVQPNGSVFDLGTTTIQQTSPGRGLAPTTASNPIGSSAFARLGASSGRAFSRR